METDITQLPDWARPEQKDFCAPLLAKGWEPYHTGGGCWAIRLPLAGDVEALMTDNDLGFPEANDWTMTIMAPSGYCEGLRTVSTLEGLDAALLAVEQFRGCRLATAQDGALCRAIEDRKTAEDWIRALHAEGLLFHFHDSPETVLWADGWDMSEAEGKLLSKQVACCYEQEWGDLECPIGFALTVLNETTAEGVE